VKDVLVMQRLPNFAIEHIMVVVNSPSRELRHPRAAQELIEEGPAGFQRCRGFGRLAGGARRLSQA
jgi:hypothetical protein